MLRIERYARSGVTYSGQPPTEAAQDITSQVASVTWSDAVEPPWQSITLRMMGSSVLAPPFNSNDHLVIRLGPLAVAWAIIVEQSTSLSKTEDGKARQAEWSVQAIGWFDYLGRVDLVTYFAVTDVDAGVEPVGGTVFASRENPWSDLQAAFNAAAPANLRANAPVRDDQFSLVEAVYSLVSGAGTSLAQFMRRAPRISVPEGLGGGTIRDATRTVHSGVTAAQLCGPGREDREGTPARAIEPIIGLNPSPQPLANGSSKLLGFIQGTWGVDGGLAEMFPSLEDPGNGEAAEVTQESTSEDIQRRLDSARDGTGAQLAASGNVLTAGPARVLGRNPVLIYRMRPWRVVPLATWIDRLQSRDSRFQTLAALVLPMLQAPEYATFAVATWDLTRAAIVTNDDVISLDYAMRDEDAATVVTAEHMGSLTPNSFETKIGLPIVDSLVSQLGARVYTVQFPFMRGADAVGGPVMSSIVQMIAILAVQGAQWHIAADRFLRGSMTLRFRPDIRPGEPVLVNFEANRVTPFPDGGQGAVFAAYCEAVSSTAEIGQGNGIERTTTVQFSRGTWVEAIRDYPGVG